MIKDRATKITGMIFIVVGTLSTTLSPYTLYFYYLPLIIFIIGLGIVWFSQKSIISKLIWTISPFIFFFSFNYIWKLSNSCEPETFILPKSYSGEVRIVFNQKCGKIVKYEGKRRVYEIPSDGILLTQFKAEQGFINQKFYILDDNKRKEIPELMVQDFNEEWTSEKNENEPPRNELAIFKAGTTYSDGNSSFYICTYDDFRNYQENYELKRDSLIEAKILATNKYCR